MTPLTVAEACSPQRISDLAEALRSGREDLAAWWNRFDVETRDQADAAGRDAVSRLSRVPEAKESLLPLAGSQRSLLPEWRCFLATRWRSAEAFGSARTWRATASSSGRWWE